VWVNDMTINALLIDMSIVLVIGIRTSSHNLFRETPQDLLIVYYAIDEPN
jgi:hypothetical protein